MLKNLRYDYLVLATGMQDVTPVKLKISPKVEGVFTVPNQQAAKILSSYISEHISENSEGRVVVYGSHLGVFTAVEGLLLQGIPGNSIDVVFTATKSEVNYFRDDVINDKMWSVLQSLGVSCHYGYKLDTVQATHDHHLNAAVFTVHFFLSSPT